MYQRLIARPSYFAFGSARDNNDNHDVGTVTLGSRIAVGLRIVRVSLSIEFLETYGFEDWEALMSMALRLLVRAKNTDSRFLAAC